MANWQITQLQFILFAIASWVNRHQQAVIEYLQEEKRVFLEQLGGKPKRFTDAQQMPLVAFPAYGQPWAFASAALWACTLRIASRMSSMPLRSARSMFWVMETVVSQTCLLPFNCWKLSR
jgi:hypothetical protein